MDEQSKEEQLLAWVERVAAFFARNNGLPLITGRVLGWLMVCDPPEQTAAQIATAIGASKASLSTAVRVLEASGFVRAVTRPAERGVHLRVADDVWERVARRKLEALGDFSEITADGLEILHDEPARGDRVRDAHRLFSRLEQQIAPLLQHRDDDSP
ncbi:GbsR/MarR family transcriptional regulator [Nonomuraea jiangxiensis]|uniref:DNA-binding transcriptional regulator GbsR, MarR family n=1 Tax=Nonomuraea jiangxiensis TaxID=633440 RepID=A0A1G8QKG5_9ACTN|nr:MarR family transcriptional regulator [Nonomuraea jiangxiensis]SDJ05242.1 DNA-binding transcriptional regulator GbsR, MarR family [Nonomuraea jiangxiensis]